MLTYALNGEELKTGTKVTVRKTRDRGDGAWVDGVRLNPGDVLSVNGVNTYMEPQPQFRDPSLTEHTV